MSNFFDKLIATPLDAYARNRVSGSESARQLGGIFSQQARGVDHYQGTIVDTLLDTHTYEIRLESGASLTGVARLLQDPGDKRMLPIGARVAVTEAFGPPMIMGVLPYTTPVENNENRLNITGENTTGGGDPNYAGKGNANFRLPNTPRDLGPNDWAQVSPDGNTIGVLEGGVNVMKSGMAQIRTHLINDLVEIISRNYRHISDMGISEIKNDNGRISWSFRGGADQLQEAGADQENWTIRMDLGASGDLFNFELTQPNGTTLFKLHVNNDGHVQLYGAKGVDLINGETNTERHLKDRTADVKFTDTLTVRADQNRSVFGNKTSSVSNSLTETIGTDRTLSTLRHETRTVGGRMEENIVGGNPATAAPGDVARQTTINNGAWQIDIGNPVAGANPAALAGYKLNTFIGDVTMNVKTKGNIQLDTLLGNVALETTAGNATLKTSAGLANVDGTTVHLGPVPASMANPVIKGTVHTSALNAYTTTSAAALSPALAATTTLLAALNPLTWSTGVVMAPAFAAWAGAVSACLTALITANSTLAAALPSTLSTKAFTA